MLEREIELSIAAETECCGVTVAQCRLLLELGLRGPSSACDLAESLALDQSTLSRTADGLVMAGLATRSEDPGNRRRQILDLSPRGREKADLIDRSCDERYESALAAEGLGDGTAAAKTVASLARALRGLRTGLSRCPREE